MTGIPGIIDTPVVLNPPAPPVGAEPVEESSDTSSSGTGTDAGAGGHPAGPGAGAGGTAVSDPGGQTLPEPHLTRATSESVFVARLHSDDAEAGDDIVPVVDLGAEARAREVSPESIERLRIEKLFLSLPEFIQMLSLQAAARQSQQAGSPGESVPPVAGDPTVANPADAAAPR